MLCLHLAITARGCEASERSAAPARVRETAGGENERFRQHPIGHFRFQARGERDPDSRFRGTVSNCGVAGRFLGAVASAGSAGSTYAKPISRADVEAILAKLAAEQREDFDWRRSIVDLMKLLKLDSGLGARKQLAQELGYTGALDGSAEMNVWLHKQVMTKLAESGGKVPDSLRA